MESANYFSNSCTSFQSLSLQPPEGMCGLQTVIQCIDFKTLLASCTQTVNELNSGNEKKCGVFPLLAVTKPEMGIKVRRKKDRVGNLALICSVIELLHSACHVPGAQHSERCV